jgi:protein SCO1/2
MSARAMNETALRLLLPALLSMLLALLLGACTTQREEPPLKGAAMGGPFELTGPDGRRVNSNQFAGRYRLVYFGFTFCPDVCPTDLAAMGAALRQFEQSDPERAERVQPIFITVDPRRDTPDVMRRYTANFHPRILGLTGTEEEIGQVARRHATYFTRGQPDAEGNYAVDHLAVTVLYGPEGEPIAMATRDQGQAGIARLLERWVE